MIAYLRAAAKNFEIQSSDHHSDILKQGFISLAGQLSFKPSKIDGPNGNKHFDFDIGLWVKGTKYKFVWECRDIGAIMLLAAIATSELAGSRTVSTNIASHSQIWSGAVQMDQFLEVEWLQGFNLLMLSCYIV